MRHSGPLLWIHGDGSAALSAASLRAEVTALGFRLGAASSDFEIAVVENPQLVDFDKAIISPSSRLSLVEQTLRCLNLDIEHLSPFIEGESKAIYQITDNVLLEQLKPTVYSFTNNRYGTVEGTDVIRARFSAELFRRMAALADADGAPRSTFLGLVHTQSGPALVQRRVSDSNLEVRVKRYHIGSPLHRYKYTEQYPTTQACGPLRRWSRFDTPVTCFDWRHPLHDDKGTRLADEPISDDYAAVWIKDMPYAKRMARNTFLWLESLMEAADLILIDMCMFIDRSGHWIFGEISPDCMRVRARADNLDDSTIFDKDLWRNGARGQEVAQRYQAMYDLLFPSDSSQSSTSTRSNGEG
jgi:phosphoribosylaminoimidazole-succinocarboxamide synthase